MAYRDWTPAQRQALVDELALPAYAGPPAMSDAAAAAALNDRVIDGERALVSASEIFNAIVPGEFEALSPAQQQRVRDVLGLGDQIDVRSGTNTRAVLLAAFAVGTGTRENLAAVVVEKISWARQIGVPAIHHLDVAAARGRS